MTSIPLVEEARSESPAPTSWLDRPVFPQIPAITIEKLIIILILATGIFTRFYILGERVMSHDETNHVVPSFDLYQGRGYKHDPITHGPLQFHLIALSFFMFGDSDFTARIPAATSSVAAIFFVWWAFRRYLGRTGALVAAFLMLISPYVLFYGRYTRNEPFIELLSPLLLFAMLAYLQTGKDRYLYLTSLAACLHFIVKETAFIYIALALVFLALVFLSRVLQRPWQAPERKRSFLLSLVLAVLLVGAAMASRLLFETTATAQAAGTAVPHSPVPLILGGLGVLVALVGLYFLVSGLGLAGIRRERSFDLVILLGTLVLPQLSAFPVKLVGWDPLNYQLAGLTHTAIFLVPMTLAAIVIGLWWRPKAWVTSAVLFYTIFTVFYTTFFTNGIGFFTGLVGSLGYWLAQQGVQRGSQPWYYYALLQIPLYEFLPAIGTLLAVYLGLKHPEIASVPELPAEDEPASFSEDPDESLNGQGDLSRLPGVPLQSQPEPEPVADAAPLEDETPAEPVFRTPVLSLLVFFSFMNLIAYSVAGEKMPWLTVHITLPMILASGLAIGYLIDTTPWRRLFQQKGLLVLLLLPVFFFSFFAAVGLLGSTTPPFQGKELVQLQTTASFIIAVVVMLASAGGLYVLVDGWSGFEVGRAAGMVFLAILAVLTMRAAWRASFINYDNAKEYLVYAHAARGPKDVLAQVEEISKRTTGGLDIAVAYDDEDLYPYWWYFRNYPNKVWYADKPTRELLNDPIIIVGDKNYDKLTPIVGNSYDMFETMRLWWPNQDYFNLTWERLQYAITNPAMRTALWEIWFNRDYTRYAQITNNPNLTLTTWQPNNRLRMYIRKDIVAKIWNYGVPPTAQPAVTDPYAKGTIQLGPDKTIGSTGSQSGQFQAPRGLAMAPDGTLYAADSRNHRIQHLSADGQVLETWGTFADVSKGAAPGGTFNEPWGVAVGPDGSVYVADTWNNRIQKFSATGQFETMWGYFGQAEQPEAFWGPRGVAVNAQGQVFVTDTGNKRVVVFDANGKYITQFGGAGAAAGQLDEPVGIAVDAEGQVYVADTWNQRVQVFAPEANGTSYSSTRTWEIAGWYGQSLENKPYLALGPSGQVVVADPEGNRILEFDAQGQFVRGWDITAAQTEATGIVSGVAVDADGNVWSSDAANNRLLHFSLPK